MNPLMRSSDEKEIGRILDFIPEILEEAETNIGCFYRSQSKVNALYRRAKGLTRTTHIEKYPTEFIEDEFSGFRAELDDIYNNLTT